MKKTLFNGVLLISAAFFSLGVKAQLYCNFSSTNQQEYIKSFVTTGGTPNISNINSGIGTTSVGYSDFSTMSIGAYPNQTIDFTITMNSLNGWYGYSIFIDWDNDFTFSASEQVFTTTTQTPGAKVGSFVVPAGQAMGQYRLRVVGDWVNPSPNACGNFSDAEAEDYTLEVITSPNCLPPTSLMVSNGTSTSIDFGWTETNSATEWEVEYGAYGFAQGSGTIASVTTTNSYTLNFTPGDETDFYVRSVCSAGNNSSWAGPYEFRYCDAVPTYQGDHLISVVSSGALIDISYSTNGYPTGGYADETAQSFSAFEGQTFNINTDYFGGNNGVNIWVDWNMDLIFDASEKMASLADTNAMKTLSITVPAGTPYGDYRMRVRSEQGATTDPSPCGSVTFGTAVDFTLTIDIDPGFTCAIPTNLTVSNVLGTSLDLGWTENGTAAIWNIEYGLDGFTPGTGTFINGVTTNPYTVTGLSGETEYQFYVQADCEVGDTSFWSYPLGPVLTGTVSLDKELLMDISIFPNPASSILTIVNPSNSSDLKVEISDVNGRIVLVENKALISSKEATLVIDQLEKGIYNLRVYNNEAQKTFKIIKN